MAIRTLPTTTRLPSVEETAAAVAAAAEEERRRNAPPTYSVLEAALDRLDAELELSKNQYNLLWTVANQSVASAYGLVRLAIAATRAAWGRAKVARPEVEEEFNRMKLLSPPEALLKVLEKADMADLQAIEVLKKEERAAIAAVDDKTAAERRAEIRDLRMAHIRNPSRPMRAGPLTTQVIVTWVVEVLNPPQEAPFAKRELPNLVGQNLGFCFEFLKVVLPEDDLRKFREEVRAAREADKAARQQASPSPTPAQPPEEEVA